MQEELQLPDLLPKPQETYEDVQIVYNDISKIGPDSLRHTRRTLLEALKRLAMTNDLKSLHKLPGNSVPIRLITPINNDRRYRQFQEIKIPSSNAVIFFARDCSGSMDAFKCDVVSDMAWWLDVWIRRFYERVERCYINHDTEANEVSEKKFYSYRDGGGTMISSAFDKIAHLIENKYPAHSYNIYIFYFTDGENWGDDNRKVVDIIQNKLKPVDVNLIGITQIASYMGSGGFKEVIDKAVEGGDLGGGNIRTIDICSPKAADGGMRWYSQPSTENRDEEIMGAIRHFLGKKKKVKV